MKYDAFISYRHGGLDGLVAEKLHKMLETYRIPSAIAKKTGKKRIKRVFRDREELPTSSNLSNSINDALENSEFLLLICSPRLLESQWCMREVEVFGELHGKDKIVALLIDGEPEEAFPQSISQREVDGKIIDVEPLAADIRAETHRQSLRLLKNEKLRLLAPILGCAYDDLKQRHRARRIRRTFTAMSAGLGFSLAFGSFSTYQYLQIDRQMQLKLENQSYVLAEYSQGVLADGDPETAMLLALEGLPKSLDRPERPYVKAAERALADSIGAYAISGGFTPFKAVELPAVPGTLLLSPDGDYAAAVYAYELVVLDTATGRIVATLPTIDSILADAEFLSERVIVYAGETGVTAYDIPSATTLWTEEPAAEIAVSADGARIAALSPDSGRARLYAPDGSGTGEISFGGRQCPVPVDTAFLNPRDFVFALSGDGSALAASFSDGSLSLFATGGAMAETVLEPPSGAIHYEGGFSGGFLAYSAVENSPYAARYAVYDGNTGETTVSLKSDASNFVALAGEDGLYFASANQIFAMDGATGAYRNIASIGGRIEVLCKSGDVLLACDSEGGYHFLREDGAAVRPLRSYQSSYVCDFAAIAGGRALTGSYDSGTVRILRDSESAAPVLLTCDPAYPFSEAKITPAGGRVWQYSYRGFRLYDSNGTLLRETDFPQTVRDTQYDKTGGNLAVLYDDALRLYSGADGSPLLEIAGAAGKKSVRYAPYGVSVLGENGRVTLYDLASGQPVQEGEAAGADFAVLAGGVLSGRDGRVFFDGREVGAGEFIGGARLGENRYAFAIATNEGGSVFTVENGAATERFSFSVRGKTEAYFAGDFVFLSQIRGVVTAYDWDGGVVRNFSEDGYAAEAEALDGAILLHFISASLGRYSLLLDGETLEAGAYLTGLLAAADGDTLLFDDGGGHLRTSRVYDAEELIQTARERLGGRTLTADEKLEYHAG